MGERILEGGPPGSEPALSSDAPAPQTEGARSTRSLFPDGAAKHWLLSSIIWLTVVDLFGLVLETAAIKPLDLRRHGWSFGVNLRQGF